MDKEKDEPRQVDALVMRFPGILNDGSHAPVNSDTARLDFISRHQKLLVNLKAGVRAANVPNHWQASVRAAIDAAMETMRRDLRSKGCNPEW